MRKIIPQKFYYVIAPGALTGFSCRAPENNSKIIFPACNHFECNDFEKDGMAPKLPNLPCFEAFGVVFCPDVCLYFALRVGGRGQ